MSSRGSHPWLLTTAALRLAPRTCSHPLESLLALLTSPDTGRCILGMTLIFGIDPEVLTKFGQGSSSSDPHEVWRARFAALGDGH